MADDKKGMPPLCRKGVAASFGTAKNSPVARLIAKQPALAAVKMKCQSMPFVFGRAQVFNSKRGEVRPQKRWCKETARSVPSKNVHIHRSTWDGKLALIAMERCARKY